MNVESTLKACLVGTLVTPSPTTQRRNSVKIVKNARSANLTVAKPIMIVDGTLLPLFEFELSWGTMHEVCEAFQGPKGTQVLMNETGQLHRLPIQELALGTGRGF